MMSSSRQDDQPMNRQLVNQRLGSVKGVVLYLERCAGPTSRERRRREISNNSDAKTRKAGFEALTTRFRLSNRKEEPSDPAG
jgi:hypothetical protein